MATTNFLQWNPSKANQETDAGYATDGTRTGGAGTNAIFPSATANKLFYQVTTLAAALGAMLANRGTSTSDADVNALTTALGAIALQADIATETSNRTTADATLTSNLASEASSRTTGDAGLQSQITAFEGAFTSVQAASGVLHIYGGVKLQWVIGSPRTEAGVSTQAGNWQETFSNIFVAFCVTKTGQGASGSAGDTDIHDFQLTGYSNTGWSVRHSVGGVYSQAQNLTPILFAIGN